MTAKKRLVLFSIVTVLLVALCALPIISSAAAIERTEVKVSDRSVYDQKNGYLYNIPLDTTAETVQGELLNKSGIQFTDASGTVLHAYSKLGTGAKIELLKSSSVIDSIQVVIRGEINGDAKLTSFDYLAIKKQFNNSQFLSGAAKEAADVNDDGSIGSTDYLQVKAYLASSEINLWPDPVDYSGQYLDLHVTDLGYDIYQPYTGKQYGYRYGASIIYDDNNNYNLYYAAPGYGGEADWITYQKAGANPTKKADWTTEKVVLQPTGNSLDEFSVCDPGVIGFGGYYYIGYTSTTDATSGGLCNSVYVARSKNPDGPFIEKWDGHGWSNEPYPLVNFDGYYSQWGTGEPSFCVVDDVLYIYFTWRCNSIYGKGINKMRVGTADALDPNWPATFEFKGNALTYITDQDLSQAQDSLDVAYVDKYDKWIAVGTIRRFEKTSSLIVYQSNNGINFTQVQQINTNVMRGCHNVGISKDSRGHIDVDRNLLISYAYTGDPSTWEYSNWNWGHWCTRMQHMSLGITPNANISDNKNSNYNTKVNGVAKDTTVIGIGTNSGYSVKNNGRTTQLPRYYRKALDGGNFNLTMITQNIHFYAATITDSSQVTFSDYDKSIISINGFTVTPKAVGKTWVKATYKGFVTVVAIEITPAGRPINVTYPDVVAFNAPFKEMRIEYFVQENTQVRGQAVFADNNHCELYNNGANTLYPPTNSKYHVTFSVGNTDIAVIATDGTIIPVSRGTTTVTATCSGKSFTIPLIIW